MDIGVQKVRTESATQPVPTSSNVTATIGLPKIYLHTYILWRFDKRRPVSDTVDAIKSDLGSPCGVLGRLVRA